MRARGVAAAVRPFAAHGLVEALDLTAQPRPQPAIRHLRAHVTRSLRRSSLAHRPSAVRPRCLRQRKAAEDRAREDTLRSYLQQMSDLITDHDLRSQRRTDTQTLARTLTLVALRHLDPLRKGVVVQFLVESGLITTVVEIERRRGGLFRTSTLPAALPVSTTLGWTRTGIPMSDADGSASSNGANRTADGSGPHPPVRPPAR